MPTKSGCSPREETQGLPPADPPEVQLLLQPLLATITSIDIAHEDDVETVRNSTVEEWLKQTVIRRLDENDRRRRAPYVRRIEELEACIRIPTA